MTHPNGSRAYRAYRGPKNPQFYQSSASPAIRKSTCINPTLRPAVTGETLFHLSLPKADQRQAQTRTDHYGDGVLGDKESSSFLYPYRQGSTFVVVVHI